MKVRARMSCRCLAASWIGGAALVLTTAGCAGTSTNNASTASSGATSDTISLTSQEACDKGAATNGGTLNYWATTDPGTFQSEIQPFNKKYPNIKIQYTALRPLDEVQRIVAEVQTHHALDVDAIAGDLPSLMPLFDQKLIQPIDWTKLGLPVDIQFQLKGYTTVRTYRLLLGLGYNTKLVQESELPSTWAALVDSKWAGQVIVDPRGVYLSGLALGMDKDQSLTWFKNFVKTDKPLIVQGATASMEKIIAGEAKLSTSAHDDNIAEQQAKGAPVSIKYLDIIPTQDYYANIIKGAKNPDAGACFISWFTSPEGQAQQLKYEFKSNKTTPSSMPAGAKLVPITTPDQAQVATDVANEFSKLMK